MSNEVKQEAPERVWITWDDAYPWPTPEMGGDEYVRADLLAAARREVWQEAIRVAQMSTKKSQAASLDIAAAEILIRRLERASANQKGEVNG